MALPGVVVVLFLSLSPTPLATRYPPHIFVSLSWRINSASVSDVLTARPHSLEPHLYRAEAGKDIKEREKRERHRERDGSLGVGGSS